MRGGSSKSWYGSDSKVWAVVGTIAAAVILACGLIHMSTNQAHADPYGCTASGLTSALAEVAAGTTGFLASHPEAEAAVNSADENIIRSYFAAHQSEWQTLQGIANPLRSLRNSCPQQVSAGDVARLFDAMSA
jgi:heme-binding protein